MRTGAGSLSESVREQIIRAHIDAENRHDIDAALATFERPRYELVSTGQVIDGRTAVAEMHREVLAAVPDMAVELLSIDHQESSSIARFEMTGTDVGGYQGAKPTGKKVRIVGIAQYLFGETGLVCERVYSLDPGPDPDGYLTRLGNTVPLSAARRQRRRPG
jgi:predicted ester cyclase